MYRSLIPALLLISAALPCRADGDRATASSVPSPIVSTKAFEVTIQTSNFGSDVYCYTWAVCGTSEKPASDWAGAINSKFKMSGSDGNYTLKVADIKNFYNLTDDELSELTKIGFIARTQQGAQTADCFIEVVQGRTNAYSGGEGTQADPFILKTAQDFADLSSTSLDWDAEVWFRLEADVNITNFAGIGSKGSPFKGHFDGNGHSVNGVTITGSQLGSATGFFNAIDGAEISDLGLSDLSVKGTTWTGGLVGYAASGSIERCYTSGAVTSTSICTGGLVGENHASITDCYSMATVTNATDYVAGGLVGKNKGTVKNCYASGAVSAYNYAGGLTGANYGTVTACTSFNPSVGVSVGNYAGKFGGNNNPENKTDNVISWAGMPMAENATHGHHADTREESLVAKATYETVLGWDFNNVWEWKTEGKHQYPLLKGIAGQTDPGHNAFYDYTTGLTFVHTDSGTLAAYPNPVYTELHLASDKAMEKAILYSLSGNAEAECPAGGMQEAVIDCSRFAAGIYVLDVRFCDGSRAIKKIIKR